MGVFKEKAFNCLARCYSSGLILAIIKSDIQMMDLVEEVESYSPQTGQPNNTYQQPNYFQPNPYPSDPYQFNLQEPSQDSTESPPKPKEKEEEEKESGCTRFFKKKFYE